MSQDQKRVVSPAITEGRIVIYNGDSPKLEDSYGNRWVLSMVNFYFPQLSDSDGDFKFPKPYIFDASGNMTQEGVNFPILFRNGNPNSPMILPFGKLKQSVLAEFYEHDPQYTNYDKSKSLRSNKYRRVETTEDGQGSVKKQIIITDGENKLGSFTFDLSRDGVLSIDLSTNSDYKADVNIHCGGQVDLRVDKEIYLRAEAIHVGGEKRSNIVLGQPLLDWLNSHVHNDSHGLITSPPVQKALESKLLSSNHTVD